MRMDLKKGIKEFIHKYHGVYTICAKLINRCPFHNSWRIKNGNIVICNGLMHKTKLRIKGKGNEVIIHSLARLKHCLIEIVGNNNKIEIGCEAVCTETQFIMQDNGGIISIGDRTGISGNTHLACIEGKKIEIGRGCMFSANIVIRVGDSHSILDNSTKQRINPSDDVSIGDNVWIGNQVCILKGTRISANSIVGTGAIVTKAFDESNIAIAGNPARIIRSNIDWCAERISF